MVCCIHPFFRVTIYLWEKKQKEINYYFVVVTCLMRSQLKQPSFLRTSDAILVDQVCVCVINKKKG